MVCPAAGRMNETAGDTGDEQLVGNDEFDDGVELLLAGFEHGVKFLSLWDRARETVEYEAVLKAKSIIWYKAELLRIRK